MKRSISQVCNISLKSSVFFASNDFKYSQSHNKVCANIIQLKKKKLIIFVLSMVFNFFKCSFLYHI